MLDIAAILSIASGIGSIVSWWASEAQRREAEIKLTAKEEEIKTEAEEKEKRQAVALRESLPKIDEQLEKVKAWIKEEKITPEEGAKKIAAIADAASDMGEEIESAIQLGLEETIKSMHDNYGWSVEDLNYQLDQFKDVMNKESKHFRSTWKEGFEKAQDSLIKGRLARTEFGATLSRKQLQDLQKGEEAITEKRIKLEEGFARQKTRLAEQLIGQERGTRAQATAELARQTAGLTQWEYGQTEAERARQERINRELSQLGIETETAAERQKMLIEQQAETLFPLETKKTPLETKKDTLPVAFTYDEILKRGGM